MNDENRRRQFLVLHKIAFLFNTITGASHRCKGGLMSKGSVKFPASLNEAVACAVCVIVNIADVVDEQEHHHAQSCSLPA